MLSPPDALGSLRSKLEDARSAVVQCSLEKDGLVRAAAPLVPAQGCTKDWRV